MDSTLLFENSEDKAQNDEACTSLHEIRQIKRKNKFWLSFAILFIIEFILCINQGHRCAHENNLDGLRTLGLDSSCVLGFGLTSKKYYLRHIWTHQQKVLPLSCLVFGKSSFNSL